VVEAPVGLCAQRNMLIRALPDVDVILFLDDDFVMAPGYVRQCVKLFEEDDSVAMVTGKVVADGILGPGLTMGEALAALAGDQTPVRDDLREVHNGYGCNMAVRASLMRQHGLWFDERLPLYGWLEDVDFSRRLAAHGRILRSQRCRGVHMGVKRGRSTGMRLGYSQIANPVYMWRKGSLSAHFALVQMGRNIAANMAHWLRPEAWVDRRGRLRGNLVAIADILRGRADPLRIREFS
jgi:GT2 family glycosyltransferase